jgi:hypothetical protein
MKTEDTIFIVCLLVLAFTLWYANLFIDNTLDNKRVVRYNCDIAEFHPDYPKEVKQKCRELLNENRTSK